MTFPFYLLKKAKRRAWIKSKKAKTPSFGLFVRLKGESSGDNFVGFLEFEHLYRHFPHFVF